MNTCEEKASSAVPLAPTPPLFFVGSGTIFNVALWDACGYFNYYARPFLCLSKALKQPSIDDHEGFFCYPFKFATYCSKAYAGVAFTVFKYSKIYLLVATFSNFSVSPMYYCTAFN